jgi:hypothetical protein
MLQFTFHSQNIKVCRYKASLKEGATKIPAKRCILVWVWYRIEGAHTNLRAQVRTWLWRTSFLIKYKVRPKIIEAASHYKTQLKVSEWKISPEKSKTMEFLGLYQVRSKIIVENKCLQQVKTLNISVVKFPVKIKRIIKKPSKILFTYWEF